MGDKDDDWWQQPEPEPQPEPKPQEPKLPEPKPQEAKPPEPKLPEAKPPEPKPQEAKPPEPQQRGGAGAPAGGGGSGPLGAARFDHQHTCPASTGDTPHVGGPVVQGSDDVDTNSKKQARVTDKLKCKAGTPDVIIEGSGTVLVNGWPAARRTSQTEHLPPASKLVEGSENVYVGGPSMIIRVLPNGDLKIGDHIIVTGTKEFKQKVVRQIGIMSTTKAGQQRLANIQSNPLGKDVKIREHVPGVDGDGSTADGSGFLMRNGTPGTPSGSEIALNPDLSIGPDGYPEDSVLFHEMGHSEHNLWGVNRHFEETTDGWHSMEEWQTIEGGVNVPGGTQVAGVPWSPSENMYLDQRGYDYVRLDHGLGFKSQALNPVPPLPKGVHWAPNTPF